MDSQKQKLIQALIEQPSSYFIEVQDASMLPDELKDKEEIHFEVKPPTVEVLSKCMLPALRIPEDIRNKEIGELNIDDVIGFKNEMAEIIAILAHGSKPGDFPKWHIEFILKNCTPKDIYQIYMESYLKMNTPFFLSSFQIASQNNPMMMNQIKEVNGLTPTNL